MAKVKQIVDRQLYSARPGKTVSGDIGRGDEVVGFLSMRDLMHFELARKTEELNRMRAYIHGVA